MGNQCCGHGDKITIKTEKQEFYIHTTIDSKITQIKSAISQKKKIALSSQILFYNGHQLEDAQTLKQFKFDPKINKLSLLVANEQDNASQAITVTIKNINFTTQLPIKMSSTIGDLKNLIQKKQNFPAKQQRIIFNRAILHDSQQIGKYGIQNGSIIHLARVLTV